MNPNSINDNYYDLNSLQELAHELALEIKAGDKIGLIGPLGSGKTTFVQFLFEALGGNPNYQVTSPTFNLVNEYLTSKGSLLHVDLYRLQNIHEWDSLDLDSKSDGKIIVIEWANKFTELKSYFNIILTFNYDLEDHLRKIKVLRNNVV
ncbi:MAG: hypothetical protein ACD_73C00200G0002 [uncultured bacterium]|nr:MAG: hypothetical protein ACD_73C00200G0002 [uncultured bacterium]